MLVFIQSLVLAFSALLPVVNPLGSALLFLGVVGSAPPEEFRQLARSVAVRTMLFLLVVELGGAALLAFFQISLPVVQLAGGFVLAAMGWQLLNEKEADTGSAKPATSRDPGQLKDKIFYPLTFPITAGPGCIVVTGTLSAHAPRHTVSQNVIAHFGIAFAIVAISFLVWLSYAYAPKITRVVAPQTVQGILRVIAFILLCIGVQIGWHGLEGMIRTLPK
jgi:multiple antibiotic resistance protein